MAYDHRGSAAASAYRAAIEATTRVIERRARYFRNQVVAVLLLGVASLAWALAARSWLGLAALLFLIPACGAFLVADARRLDDWRSAVLASWVRREIDLAAFRDAICAHPALPKETTNAMLATLPQAGDLASEQRILTPTRRAAASASQAAHRGRVDALVLNVAVSAIATGVVAAALWTHNWTPLLGLTTLALRPLAGAALRRRRLTARATDVAACRRQPEFQEAEYERLLPSLP
jgi:hypothetical protein